MSLKLTPYTLTKKKKIVLPVDVNEHISCEFCRIFSKFGALSPESSEDEATEAFQSPRSVHT